MPNSAQPELEVIFKFTNPEATEAALGELCWRPPNDVVAGCALNGTPNTLTVFFRPGPDEATIAKIASSVGAVIALPALPTQNGDHSQVTAVFHFLTLAA